MTSLVIPVLDIFELGSFLAMLYSSGLAIWLVAKAYRLRSTYAVLMALLASMLGLHALHHLFTLLGYETLDVGFEFSSAIFALILVSVYVYAWGKI